jgi:hypothetical protein
MSESTNTFGNYTIQKFPPELGSERFPHFVMFFINQNEKSLAAGQKPVTNAPETNNNGRGASRTIPGLSVKYTRTNEAIALYMPPQINTRYNVEYAEADVNMMGNAIVGAMDQFNQGGVFGALASALKGIPETEARMLAHTAGAAMGSADMILAATGKMENPRTEALFKTVGLRTHNFSFTFMPKNSAESEIIQGIIKTFKMNMHPKLYDTTGSDETFTSASGNYLITPNQFDIEFHYATGIQDSPTGMSGTRNTKVHRIVTSVLTSMDVNYAGTGNWVAFQGKPDPASIQMSLTFKEIELLDRDMIDRGF